MPVHLFFVCAQNTTDREFLAALLTQLKPLHREGHVTWWHEAAPGEDMEGARSVNLELADLIIIVVSPDLNADPLHYKGIAEAQLRRQKIIPILARACMWEHEVYGTLQPLPRNRSWIGKANRDRVLSEIAKEIEAVVHGMAPPPAHVAYHPRWYVQRIEEERRALGYLQHPGQPVVLLGERHCGKTWSLKHLLDTVYQTNRHSSIVEINLDLFTSEARNSFGGFLSMLSRHISDQLGTMIYSEKRVSTGAAELDLKDYLQHAVLPGVVSRGGYLYLAIDQADTLWARPFRDDLFRMLRAWTQIGTRTYDLHSRPWHALRLLVAISTPPHRLVTDLRQSPFNLTEPIQMDLWTIRQVKQLAMQYSIACDDADAHWVIMHARSDLVQMRRILFRARELGFRQVSQLITNTQGEIENESLAGWW